MAKRYHSIINDDGDFVEVRIYDSSFSGASTEFTIAANSPVFTYDSKLGDNLFESRIIGSSVSVDVVVRYDDTDLIDFFDDIVTSSEGRFVMEVITEEIGFWRGIIMPDQAEFEDGIVSIYNITATDGLASLRTKKYEYDKDVQNKTPRSFVTHIIEILKLIPFVDEFYEDTDVILSTYTNFRNVAGHTGGVDPIKYTGCFNFFYEIKNNIATYDSAWDVLDQICEVWNARVFYKGHDNDGGYKFESIDARFEDSGKEWVYYKNGTLRNYKSLNDADLDISNALTDSHVVRGGSFGFLPPLKTLTKNFISERSNFNLLRNIDLEGSMTGAGVITNPASVDLYFIQQAYYTNLRLAAKLDFDIKEEIATLWTGNNERLKDFLIFNIKITIFDGTTNYRLDKINSTVVGDTYAVIGDGRNTTVINPDDLQWTSGTSTDGINYYMRFPPRSEVESTGSYGAFNDILEFVTPVLPTYGTISLEITIPSANFITPDNDNVSFNYATYVTSTTGRELEWKITGKTRNERNSSIILSSSTDGDLNKGAYGDQDSEVLPLIVEVDENNTFSIEKEVKLADRVVGRDQYEWASQQQLLITDVAIPIVSNWEVSDGAWNYDGVGTATEIEKLVTERMARMQSKPVRYFNGTIVYNSDSNIRPLFNRLISYRSKTYMPMQIKWDMHRDIFTGVWAEVQYDSGSTVTVNAKEQDDSERSRNTRRSSSDTNTAYKVGAEASGNRFAVKPRFKSFTMAGTSTLDISSDFFQFSSTDHSVDQINANSDIVINNILYRYVDSDVSMPQNSWTLTQTTNPDDTVTFWRNITGNGYIKEWDHYNL